MKKFYASLLVVLTSVFFTQQNMAQYNNQRVNYNNNYNEDLSDFLDMEAVITVFSQSDEIEDFERRLNDYRNQVSNLDLNGDGYVDYLRIVKLTDRNAHILLIQAVLGRDNFQDVMTIVVGKDKYYRTYVQFIGDNDLYGKEYIIEPDFDRKPDIVRWLWYDSPQRWVSRYYWNYYPSYYRLRPLLSINIYFDHIFGFRDYRHHYRYVDYYYHPITIDVLRPYRRNDYWQSHHQYRFDERNKNVKNKRQFEENNNRPKPPVTNDRNRSNSENERRGNYQNNNSVQPGTSPSRNNPGREERVTPPQRPQQREEERVTPPQRQEPRREQQTTPARPESRRNEGNTVQRPTPQRNEDVTPQRSTPQRNEEATPQRTTPQRETRVAVPKPEVKEARPVTTPQKAEKNTGSDKDDDKSESKPTPKPTPRR